MHRIYWIIFLASFISTALAGDLINPHCKAPKDFDPVKRGFYKKTGNLTPETLYADDELDPKDWRKSKVYSTERQYDWMKIKNDYSGQIQVINADKQIESQMRTCANDPAHCGSRLECPDMQGNNFNSCKAYVGYCTENFIRGAMQSDVGRWNRQITNCLNDHYFKKHPDHCDRKGFADAKYLGTIYNEIKKSEMMKTPEARAFLAQASEEFKNLAANISLLEARDKARKAKNEQLAKEKELKDMENLAGQCKKWLDDNHDNPKDRKLVEAICPVPIAPVNSIPKSFLDDMAALDKKMDSTVMSNIMDEVQKESLYLSFTSRLTMFENFNGFAKPNVRKDALKKFLCADSGEPCKEAYYKKSVEEAVDIYTKHIPAQTKNFWDEKTLQQDTSEFNGVVDEINKLCTESRSKHNDATFLDMAVGMVTNNPAKVITGSAMAKVTEEANMPKAKALLDKLAKSKMGQLMHSPSFASHVGAMDLEGCVKGKYFGMGKVQLEKIPADPQARNLLLKSTVKDLEDSGVKFGEELRNDRKTMLSDDDDKKVKTLKKYVLQNPEAIKNILASNPSCKEFKTHCKLIDEILSDDATSANWDSVVGGLAAVAAVAGAAVLTVGTLGIGAPAAVALLASTATVLGTTATVATLTNASFNYANADKELKYARTGGTNKTLNQKDAVVQGNNAQVIKSNQVFDAATEVLLEATGLTLTKVGAKMAKNTKNASRLVDAGDATFPGVRQMDQIVEGSEALNDVKNAGKSADIVSSTNRAVSSLPKKSYSVISDATNPTQVKILEKLAAKFPDGEIPDDLLQAMDKAHNTDSWMIKVVDGIEVKVINPDKVKNLQAVDDVLKKHNIPDSNLVRREMQKANILGRESKILTKAELEVAAKYKPMREAQFSELFQKPKEEIISAYEDLVNKRLALEADFKTNGNIQSKFGAKKYEEDIAILKGQLKKKIPDYDVETPFRDVPKAPETAKVEVAPQVDVTPKVDIQVDKNRINEIRKNIKHDEMVKKIDDAGSIALKDRIGKLTEIENDLLKKRKEAQELYDRSYNQLAKEQTDEAIRLRQSRELLDNELSRITKHKADAQSFIDDYKKIMTKQSDDFSDYQLRNKKARISTGDSQVPAVRKQINTQISELQLIKKKIDNGSLDPADFPNVNVEINKLEEFLMGIPPG